MRFGDLALADAAGSYLAHSLATPSGTLRKGTFLTPDTLARIATAGHDRVTAATLSPDDLHEDVAAARIAAALAGPGVRADPAATGRANLHADVAGLLTVDAATVDRINRLDPAITVATRPPLRGVEAGRMVATVKIIPFAVPAAAVEAAEAAARAGGPVAVAPYRPLRVAVVSTLLPSLKPSVVEKTVATLAERLAPAGARITADRRVPHDPAALAAVLAALAGTVDLIVIFGASAVVDHADVVPAAIAGAGGRIIHLGMPVDPGNLLILADIAGVPVLGAPGCARSPRENGFDWVLERILAGSIPTAGDIMGLGVGGLLMDIVSRPAPRAGDALREDPDAPRVAAVVLAAGRSSRFGAMKLLAPVDGVPMVRRAAEAALGSRAAAVVVVTGHEGEAVAAALDGLAIRRVHNPAFADGQATSVAAGIAAVPDDCEAAVILLADMPAVDAAVVDRVIAAYRPAEGSLVVVPTSDGRRGNPVLWSRRYFADLAALTGDTGARALIRLHADAVVEVEIGRAVAIDIDTPEALTAFRP